MGPKPGGAGAIGSNFKGQEAPMPTGYSASTGPVLVLVALVLFLLAQGIARRRHLPPASDSHTTAEWWTVGS